MTFGKSLTLEDDLWAPVADLMAVIMLMFMLIVMVLFIGYSVEKQGNIKKCEAIRSVLDAEFKDDFEEWGAELQDDLTILFTNERVLFEKARADIPQGGWFARMLDNFFPRYMGVIANEIGKEEILQIRIDGHTSSEYGDYDVDAAYMANMGLSQERARNILGYVLSLSEAESYKEFARAKITANGLSSSQLIETDGQEDKDASRRVEFKLLANSCQKAGVYDASSPI